MIILVWSPTEARCVMLRKSSIVLCCVLIVLNDGAPLHEVTVEKFTNEQNEDHYTFSYSLSDGQYRFERGRFETSDIRGEPMWVVNGMYGYVSPEGKIFRYKYTADENGYLQFSDKIEDPVMIDLLVGQRLEPGNEDGRVVGNRIDSKALLSLVG